MAEPPAMPVSPLTDLEQKTAALHEIALAYEAAGFTRREAVYLIGQSMRAASADDR